METFENTRHTRVSYATARALLRRAATESLDACLLQCPLACSWRSLSRCTATAGVTHSLKWARSTSSSILVFIVRASDSLSFFSLFLSLSLSLCVSRRLSLCVSRRLSLWISSGRALRLGLRICLRLSSLVLASARLGLRVCLHLISRLSLSSCKPRLLIYKYKIKYCKFFQIYLWYVKTANGHMLSWKAK